MMVSDATKAKAEAIMKRILEEAGSGELSSTLGRQPVVLVRKKFGHETDREFRERLDREDALQRDMDRDPSRVWTGQRIPVRYDE